MSNEAFNQNVIPETATEERARDLSEFSEILNQEIKPRTDEGKRAVEMAMSALVGEALEDQSLIEGNVLRTLDAMLAKIDQKLSDQTNAILHAPEFQELESTWRGLAHTLRNSDTSANLQIKVLNLSKDELIDMALDFPDDLWEQSPMHGWMYKDGLGVLGGMPVGTIIGDYYFDHGGADVAALRFMGKISEASLAPFVSGTAPTLFGRDSWNELSEIPDLGELFLNAEYAQWNSLRDDESTRFLALAMPRAMVRAPYAPGSTSVVREFTFVEETDGHAGNMYGWMNAAHPMAVNINRAFSENGWAVNIRGVQSGGQVKNLPVHTFDTGDGGQDMKCPTEISITDSREGELSKAGLMGLIHRKHTTEAAFIGAQTLYKPKIYVDDDATASDNVSSRLPYIFAVSRFSHYLKVIVRDKVGSSATPAEIQSDLQSWINKYVTGNPESASDEEKAKKPLAGAKVEVIEDELNPGYYTGKFYLKPHFQLEGMDIGMSLVSKLPST